MSTAEWGIVLGLVGTITGTSGLLWRVFEWWMAGRSRLKVIGSAGQATPGGGQIWMARGERFGESHVIVDVINVSRRPITVSQVGFLHRAERRSLTIIPAIPQQLPVRLETGEKVTVFGDAQRFLEEAGETTDGFVSYCEDAEDRTYTGKVDWHFRRLMERRRQDMMRQDRSSP
jgi:hypothetical protein